MISLQSALSHLCVPLLGLLIFGCANDQSDWADKSPTNSRVEVAIISPIEVAILSIDGQRWPKPFDKVELEPGEHTLQVAYPTLMGSYQCTFKVNLKTGGTYEIIERSDHYPVSLNEIRKWPLLTVRKERFAPDDCFRLD